MTGPEALRPRRQRSRAGAWIAGSLAVLLGAGALVAAPWDPERRQAYADQWVVWTEPADPEIERLASELGLTEDGRRVFLASRPSIDEADVFQEHCSPEDGVVLGCYHRGRIHVYRVTDARLAGTTQATAAHELLHAWYARLGAERRARVDALVAAYVATLPEDDPTIRTVEDGYAPDQRADEWHSRLGTDYADLPPELEEHYAEVFRDRRVVVAFATQSRAALDDYTARIERLSAELDAASAALGTRAAAYDAAREALTSEIEAFNARADAGGFDSREDFDRERAALLARQDALETERLALNADVAAYNAKLEELRELDAARAALYAKLDARQEP